MRSSAKQLFLLSLAIALLSNAPTVTADSGGDDDDGDDNPAPPPPPPPCPTAAPTTTTTTIVPPPLVCSFIGNVTVECANYFYSIRTLGGEATSALVQELEDGAFLLIQVEDGGLPSTVHFSGRDCRLGATGFSSALWFPNDTCTGFTEMPSTSPAQWLLQLSEPQVMSVVLTKQDSINFLTLNVICDASASSTAIQYAIQVTSFDITVYVAHCSACAEGCPLVPVQCETMNRNLQFTCGSSAFNLETLQGNSNFAFAYASNEEFHDETLTDVYFFDLIGGLSQVNTVLNYTCELGNPNDDDQGGIYFLAHTNSSSSEECYPIALLPFKSSYNMTLWTTTDGQYLQMYYPTTLIAGVSLTVNIVCDPQAQYATVSQGGHDSAGNLVFSISHESACGAGAFSIEHALK